MAETTTTTTEPKKKAGRPKKVTTEPKTTQLVEERVDLSAILAQMEAMKQQIDKLSQEKDNAINELAKALNGGAKADEDEYNADTEVEVFSNTVGTLTLSTGGMGQGVLYRFENFGDSQYISLGDLKEICKSMPTFAQQGYFTIKDMKAVKYLKLTRYYNRLVDGDALEHLFDKTADEVGELYDLASAGQKEQICSLVENKLLNKEKVDMNIVHVLQDKIGRSFLPTEE